MQAKFFCGLHDAHVHIICPVCDVTHIIVNYNNLLWATGLYDCGNIPDEKRMFKNHTWSKLEIVCINKLRVHTLLSSNSMNIDTSPTHICGLFLASFPGPTQLSVACSTEKYGDPWYLFSCEHDVYSKIAKIFRTNWLRFAYCSTDYTLNARCIRQSPSAS